MIQLLQAVRLRTDEAAGERIILVSANSDDRVARDRHYETIGGLTERTDPVDSMTIGRASAPSLLC
jgi:hypothetical protein